MRTEQVALIPRCQECRKLWLPDDAERWQAHWIDEGPEDRLLFHCETCAEREFGTSRPDTVNGRRAWFHTRQTPCMAREIPWNRRRRGRNEWSTSFGGAPTLVMVPAKRSS